MVQADAMTGAPRLLCDEMLGHLARDLRLMGIDTAYVRNVGDAEVLEAARRERRLLLTRDRRLAAAAGADGFLVTALDPARQVGEVVATLGLRPPRSGFLTRCTDCNGRLETVPSAGVADRLPETVRDRFSTVDRCPGCGHLYWEGSHVESIRKRLGPYLVDTDA